MGFGWMFLGYMLLLKTNLEFLGIPLDITPDVIGFLLMARGFTVASEHCDCFRTTKTLSFVGIPVSAVVILIDALAALNVFSLPASVSTVISYIYSFSLSFSRFAFCARFIRSRKKRGSSV